MGTKRSRRRRPHNKKPKTAAILRPKPFSYTRDTPGGYWEYFDNGTPEFREMAENYADNPAHYQKIALDCYGPDHPQAQGFGLCRLKK